MTSEPNYSEMEFLIDRGEYVFEEERGGEMTDTAFLYAKPSGAMYCYIGEGENRYRVERHRTESNVLFTLHRISENPSVPSARRTFGDLMWSIFACVDAITPEEYAALYALREAK